MELSFSRNRIYNTTLYAPSSDGVQPAYTIKTTKGPLLLPHKTVIEYVGDSDAEKRHVAAVILWNWPSQKRSHIFINGKLMSLSEFMPFGSGFMNSDSYVRLGENMHMWRSIGFEPQLYDATGRRVVSYVREPLIMKLPFKEPKASISIVPETAADPALRDVIIASLFLFRACRDVTVPWQRNKAPIIPMPKWADEHAGVGLTQAEAQAFVQIDKSEEKEEKHKASDGLGEYTRIPEVEAGKV